MYIWGKNELILLRKDQTQINCPEINIAHFLYSSYKLKGIFLKKITANYNHQQLGNLL